MSAATTTQLMTADELIKLPRGKARYELIKGELRTMPPAGSEHGSVAVNVTLPLGNFVKANQLGVVFAAETGYKIATDPDTVRAPDVSFIRRERIPEGGLPKNFWQGAPDLAVEVISPGDTVYEVDEQVAEWLAAGAAQVWIVNSKRRTVTIHHATGETFVLTVRDEIDGGALLPGFRLRVAEIFS